MEITVRIKIVNQKLIVTCGHVVTQVGSCHLSVETWIIARVALVGFEVGKGFSQSTLIFPCQL
jgi:hypothetical protein